jgi:AraC-like DNA-binding protein
MMREIDAAGVLDVPVREICQLVGLDVAHLDDPGAMVSLQSLADVYEAAAHETRDDAFGLHVGELARPVALDILDYAVMSRPTIAQAFEAVRPLVAAMYPEAEIRLFVRDKTAGFSYRMDAREARAQRHRCEALVTTVRKIAERAVGRSDPPLSVAFQHAAPQSTSEHRRIFRAPVHFDCPAAEILFSPEWLVHPVPTADPNLCTVLDRYVQELLARLPKSFRFSDRARQALFEAFRSGAPSLPQLAKRLGVSERTLQRRLQEERTSLQALTDGVRHELSLEHLRNPSLSLCEVADRLGYSSLAAFSRAFRRWRGVSPAEHRRTTRPLHVA